MARSPAIVLASMLLPAYRCALDGRCHTARSPAIVLASMLLPACALDGRCHTARSPAIVYASMRLPACALDGRCHTAVQPLCMPSCVCQLAPSTGAAMWRALQPLCCPACTHRGCHTACSPANVAALGSSRLVSPEHAAPPVPAWGFYPAVAAPHVPHAIVCHDSLIGGLNDCRTSHALTTACLLSNRAFVCLQANLHDA